PGDARDSGIAHCDDRYLGAQFLPMRMTPIDEAEDRREEKSVVVERELKGARADGDGRVGRGNRVGVFEARKNSRRKLTSDGQSLRVRRLFELLLQIRVLDRGAGMRGHQTADSAVDENMYAAHTGFEQRALVLDAILQRIAQVAGKIRSNLRVLRPDGFGMIAPADNCAERCAIGWIRKVHHADIGIE